MDGLIWVFGYGSLMWNPGFAYQAFEPGRLDGWHRRFCVTSRHYRGTPERPGLVLGLAPGGSCTGRALGVAAAQAEGVLACLDAREHVGGIYVYDRQLLPVTLLRTGVRVEAWCYVARPDHQDVVLDLDDDALLARVAAATGAAGSNRDYVLATVRHLREIGIAEGTLEALARSLGREHEAGQACRQGAGQPI
jgi:cation transport protein ChaC